MSRVWCRAPLVIPSAPGALFGEALRTAFSISGMVMSGHSIGGGYWYLSVSERLAWSGGGKKDWRSTSAFSSGSWASSPLGFANVGVHEGATSCLFLAHLTSFQRPPCESDASSTL